MIGKQENMKQKQTLFEEIDSLFKEIQEKQDLLKIKLKAYHNVLIIDRMRKERQEKNQANPTYPGRYTYFFNSPISPK